MRPRMVETRPMCEVSTRKDHPAWVYVRAHDRKTGKIVGETAACRTHARMAIGMYVDGPLGAYKIDVRGVWER